MRSAERIVLLYCSTRPLLLVAISGCEDILYLHDVVQVDEDLGCKATTVAVYEFLEMTIVETP